ncbi:MAG: tRNA (guanosine(46)-N7)-methyltransferase TrmB [Alphaproteobacteria bacterium]|nr:tRNA (guanosine(46)-N7)-methyltransferase TrmB [Alphaproteobacteria bacterium]
MEKQPPKWLSSFGRRKGRPLTPEQKEVMGGFYSSLAVPPALPGPSLENPFHWFQTPVKDIWFEIGLGKGEHMLGQAYNHPDIGFVGCETYVNGISAFLVLVEKFNYQNIRASSDDARLILERIENESLGRVFILFPDPWPKKRHEKRRLIQHTFLDLLAQKMKPGAELRIATDHQEYAQWIIFHMTTHTGFTWMAESKNDWLTPPSDWIQTRYQQKAHEQGRGAIYLRFARKMN